MKKTLCLLLSAMLILTAVLVPVFADTANGYSDIAVERVDLTGIPDIQTLTSENYSETSAWKITDAAGLRKFSATCNEGDPYTFSGKTVYLANDIDMTGMTDFKPIAYNSGFGTSFVTAFNSGVRFSGTFDGQGHCISNLVMTFSASDCTSVALFGAVRGGCIRNLVLDSSCSFSYQGSSAKVNVGSVVGMMFANGSDGMKEAWADPNAAEVTVMVENVRSSAVVSLVRQGDGYQGYAGGLVGYVGSGTGYFAAIRNCTFDGVVSGRATGVGGIYGCWMEGGRNLLCKNTLMTGKIAGKGTYVGSVYGQGKPTVDMNNVVGKPFADCGYSETLTVPVDLTDVADINTLAASNDQGFDTEAYHSGTAWKITDAAGLMLLSKISNTGKDFGFAGKTVYLANDLDLLGNVWTPIANAGLDVTDALADAVCFRGTLDGQGHSIRNLKASSDSSGNAAVALIGTGCGFAVRNLVLDETCSFSYTGTSAKTRVAGLIGTADTGESGFTIENVLVRAAVTSSEGCAAGLVSVVTGSGTDTSEIKNCTVEGDVLGETAAAGGIANAVGGSVELSNVICSGNVTATHTGAGIAVSTGGILTARACQMTATVSANQPAAILAGANVTQDADCRPAFATVRKTELEKYYGYGTAAVDYADTVGYDASRIEAKDLTDVLPICTFLDAPMNVVEFKISTPDDLLYFAEMVNAGADFKGCTIYLEHDINMSGKTMLPIGSPAGGSFDGGSINSVNHFAGTFDGQGHIIDNLVMTSDVSVENQTVMVALFGLVKSATVRNVVLGSGCSFGYTGTGVGYAAGLVAIMYRQNTPETGYQTVIDNCCSLASVSGTRSVAGIVASVQSNTNNDPAVIRNCTNAGNVTTKEFGAGILAYIYNRPVQILNCRNTGTITLQQTEAAENRGVAGIFARPASTQTIIIRNCINNGKIAGPGIMGGIVAIVSSESTAIDRCTNYGELACSSSNPNVGTMCGIYQPLEYDQMTNNCDAMGKTDDSLSSLPAVTPVFPDYDAIDAAHSQLFGEPDPGDDPSKDPPKDTDEATGQTTEDPGKESKPADSGVTTNPSGKKESGGCASAVSCMGGLLVFLLCMGTAGVTLHSRRKD